MADNKKMKGLYCRAGESRDGLKFFIQKTHLPEVLGSHLVRVQVKACGLSPLDLQLLGDLGLHRDVTPVGREVAGVVLRVGEKVSFFQVDDEVVGILPLGSSCSGLCDVIDIDEHYIVQKPEQLSSVCVAGAIRDGLCAYTALHTHARVAAGHTLLVMDGASSFGLMCLQLACYHGVKVLTTSHSPEQHAFLEQLRPSTGWFGSVFYSLILLSPFSNLSFPDVSRSDHLFSRPPRCPRRLFLPSPTLSPTSLSSVPHVVPDV
ncbi:quinone oxidoreductase-like protein 1, partial [Brachionichthys hirsutus]|uniref:quinone oxidoreductase-like protein 1 n=1 Tax=Brachionichthys hirsutus TaxID=412623 RepID=UPI0036049D59